MKRIFLALDLPRGVVATLKKSYDRALPVRWTKPENLHVTLHFLGDLGEQEIETLAGVVERVCSRHEPIRLEFNQVRPERSMIWVTVKPSVEISRFQHDLAVSCTSADLAGSTDHTFRPHVCLARSRTNLENLNIPPRMLANCRFVATHVVIFESILGREGPTYVSLDAFPLRF